MKLRRHVIIHWSWSASALAKIYIIGIARALNTANQYYRCRVNDSVWSKLYSESMEWKMTARTRALFFFSIKRWNHVRDCIKSLKIIPLNIKVIHPVIFRPLLVRPFALSFNLTINISMSPRRCQANGRCVGIENQKEREENKESDTAN